MFITKKDMIQRFPHLSQPVKKIAQVVDLADI